MTNVNLEWALYYQKQGLSIIPVREKMPLIKWKEYQSAPAREEQIKEWWEKYSDADIGLVTGSITKRLVLDVDGPTGADSIKDLTIPATQTVRTRRGVQYHFRWSAEFTGKTTVAGVLPGVDVRGEGGYVKMPPSKCSDGTLYEFHTGKGLHEIELAEAPEWLKKLLIKPIEQKVAPAISGKENWIGEVIDGVGMGDRHEAFKKLAGYYFNLMHPDVAAQHLRDWNSKNTPPMEDMEDKIADMMQRFKNGEYESKFLEKKAAEPKDLAWMSAKEVVSNFSSRLEFLVEQFIPVASNIIFGGWQGMGKTYVAMDLVIEVARKKGMGKWLDRFNVQQGPVLYVDNELGGNRTSYRLRQLLGPKGLNVDDLDLHYLIRKRFKLANEKNYAQLKEKIAATRPKLVVIDSFASCCAPLDENTSKDMRFFFDDLVAPLCEEYKCTVLFIDHEGKGVPGVKLSGSKRLRGSGAKGDAVDMVFSVQMVEGVTMFEHSKVRDTKRLDPFAIEIVDVANGVMVRELQRIPA